LDLKVAPNGGRETLEAAIFSQRALVEGSHASLF